MVYLPSNKFLVNSQIQRTTGRHCHCLSSILRRIKNYPLTVTLDQIKQEALRNEYINRIKTKVLEKDQHTTDIFSTCDDALLDREHVMILLRNFINFL